MNPCDQHSIDMTRYLENELSGRELADFRSHLLECVNFRSILVDEQALSALLKRSGPYFATARHRGWSRRRHCGAVARRQCNASGQSARAGQPPLRRTRENAREFDRILRL